MIKVLLIEDNKDHAFLIIGSIKTAYFEEVQITHELNLAGGLQRINEVDIVISDLNIPDSSGLETITTLISKIPYHVPLLVLTSKDDYDLGAKAVTLGAQDYLVKGVLPPQSIRRCIDFSIIRKKYEHKIIQEREKASQVASYQSNFLATMSHEIRTPLNTIIGLSDYLVTEYQNLDKEKINEYISTIGRVSNILLSIINDILDLSKLEAKEINLIPQNLNVNNFVKNIQSMLQHELQKKENTLTVNVASNIPNYLVVDIERLQQVVLNLLTNANKFTKNGNISLSIEFNHKEKDSVLVTISDSGIGIPKEKMPLLFTPFKQLEIDTFKKYGGTGLGLSICKEIVGLMKGEIWAESTPNKGSSFYFTFPFILGGQEKIDYSNINQNYSLANLNQNLRILSVDDSIDNQNLIKVYLQKYPFDITFATDGKEAVEKFKKDSFNIVLMDMQLPIQNGYEATYEIREWEKINFKTITPIVALTASTLQRELDMCYKVGCSDYLSKPITKSNLLIMINKVIENSKNNKTSEKEKLAKVVGTVLIVDDEKEILNIVKEEFENSGWKVYTALFVSEAYGVLKEFKIDVVITDYSMPITNGFEFFKRCVNEKMISPDKFLFTSGYAEELHQRLSQDNNLDNKIFVKPFDISALINKAKEMVCEKSLHSPNKKIT